ncbi:hypothetical protein [Ktedonospora formicarum]|uniref:Uncharacterized protein n=1 Tax=Ktedonospora formicarum TaxID=2778364 RepID=A0A8J3MZ17_9CHLR|nr:hypothetical protein [Ktedonospora formicarum]GHO50300.1 hypothetical protein KSX_84630 [Ktedonospora formicarum]
MSIGNHPTPDEIRDMPVPKFRGLLASGLIEHFDVEQIEALNERLRGTEDPTRYTVGGRTYAQYER